MRHVACLAFAACCLSSPALGQSASASDSALPSPEEIAGKDMITIGVGIAVVPDYEGSDDYRIIPAGAIRARIHGLSISTNGTYLYADLVPQSGKLDLDAGPIVGVRFDSRRHTDDPVVKLMLKRKTAYEVGGFAGVSLHGLVDPYDTLALHLDILHDIGSAHKSTTFDPNVSFSTPVSRKTYVSLSAGAEFVSSKFANYYFGVSPGDVVATGGGLPLYHPGGGMKNWKTSLLLNQSITGDLLGGLSVFGMGQYSRLVGDFKRSPIVAMRGSASQWLGAVGLAYTW
jgi:outer membrane scaffolding protein for murein synthesis (MipA/OmpV family)